MKVAFCILSFLESILLQMEQVLRTRPGGVVGKLMAKPDPGWRFLRGCLMLLDPKDLKACRQSCKSLNNFIKHQLSFWQTSSNQIYIYIYISSKYATTPQ